jgi:transposase
MGKSKNAVETIQENTTASTDTGQIIKRILNFLQLFMCETLAKRIISMVLIALDVPNHRVTELTGLCDKSVRKIKKALAAGDIANLFRVGGGGRHRKLIDVEKDIIEEVNKNNYYSQQQIADMVYEKFGIKVSPDTIRRLLKKTASNA